MVFDRSSAEVMELHDTDLGGRKIIVREAERASCAACNMYRVQWIDQAV